jgi:hypothetical protein
MARQRPPMIERMLARPAMLADEDKVEFQELFEAIWADENPETLEQCLIVADIANVVWDLFRLRGLKVRALNASLLETFVKDQYEVTRYIDLTKSGLESARIWHAAFRRDLVGVLFGDAAAKVRLEKFLEPLGFTLETIVATNFRLNIATQLSADRLVEAAYQRRNALYADLERARSKARRTGNMPPTVESPSVAEGDELSAPAKHEDRVEDVAGESPRGGQS